MAAEAFERFFWLADAKPARDLPRLVIEQCQIGSRVMILKLATAGAEVADRPGARVRRAQRSL